MMKSGMIPWPMNLAGLFMKCSLANHAARRCVIWLIELMFPDVTSFIAAIVQADQLGVGIGKVLRIQSEQMRVRRRQRAEEKAQQAPVKMMFPMVFLIFPSIFIVLLGPALFQILRSQAVKGVRG
ncbi:MAG: hypothetical protein HC804_00835 [Anaerolineae bacterium]|nr:hypothetical protein [Anaerolineae bacterium]